jgi:hypothetical protein
MRVLAPFNELRAAPLDHILMAITGVRCWGGQAASSEGG